MKTKSSLCVLIILCFFSLIFLAPISVNAALYSTDLGFETSDQNMWGGGSAIVLQDVISLGQSWDYNKNIEVVTGGSIVTIPGYQIGRAHV